jgi:hypothetical protein
VCGKEGKAVDITSYDVSQLQHLELKALMCLSMRPPHWHPPVELSAKEQQVVSRIRKAKLFIFLRQIRHQLFDQQFQTELATLFKDSSVGKCPVSPAQLALALILQAYTGVSDDEVIEALEMDRRWQLVLNCLDGEQAPFSKATLVRFRAVLIAKGGDRKLVERTVEIAKDKGNFSATKLRAALDSSPLWGAARVEDTYNLLGHALRKALVVIARSSQRNLASVSAEAGAEWVAASSLKAALDLDWNNPVAKAQALSTILTALDEVESWLQENSHLDAATSTQAQETLAIGRQVQAQDVEEASDGSPKLRRGVAKNRRISIEDGQMRHGRKSRQQRFDGYKRHVLTDLELGVVRAVGITAANEPEASVTDDIAADLKSQNVQLKELHIDRAYLNSTMVKQRSQDLTIVCKAWPVRNGKHFTKDAFTLNWEQGLIYCPNQVAVPFETGKVAHFPAAVCAQCPLQQQCTSSQSGRSVSIHAEEPLLQELRQRQLTAMGRAKLRQRVAVEHTLARVGQWQGDRARYIGVRKNLFDLRRMAVVHNLHVIARMSQATVEASAG